MKKLMVFLLLGSKGVAASGITGSSGNELLYVYLLLLGVLLTLLGIDQLIKFTIRKVKEWRFNRLQKQTAPEDQECNQLNFGEFASLMEG